MVQSAQERLQKLGIQFGASPVSEQVTVAKQRTMFQTQVLKSGETDVSHKDYLLTWGLEQRRATMYTPELYTQFGIDRQGRTIRLPTTAWPFDHAAVSARILLRKSRRAGSTCFGNACTRVGRWISFVLPVTLALLWRQPRR